MPTAADRCWRSRAATRSRRTDGQKLVRVAAGLGLAHLVAWVARSCPGDWLQLAQQLVHGRDLFLLAGSNVAGEGDRVRVLPVADLGVCHGDRALVVPDHPLEEQFLAGRAIGFLELFISAAPIMPSPPP